MPSATLQPEEVRAAATAFPTFWTNARSIGQLPSNRCLPNGRAGGQQAADVNGVASAAPTQFECPQLLAGLCIARAETAIVSCICFSAGKLSVKPRRTRHGLARAEGPDVGLAIGYQAGNFDAPPQSLVQYRTHKGAIKSFEELAKIPGLRAGIFDYRKENIVY